MSQDDNKVWIGEDEMNLDEKECLLAQEVAYPSLDEYGFTGDTELNRLLAEAVNRILSSALKQAAATHPPFGQIVRLVYIPLKELQSRYHDTGLCSPKTYSAIGRFWGLNYCPEIYCVMRFPPQTMIEADHW